MKNLRSLSLLLAVNLLAVATPAALLAQDSKPADNPKTENAQDPLKNMPPEKRQEQINQMRQQFILRQAAQMGMDTNQLKGLSPQEQQAKLFQYRKEHFQNSDIQHAMMVRSLGLNADDFKNLKGDEWTAKFKKAAEDKLAALQKKKADGGISKEEDMQLARLERLKKVGFAPPSMGRPPMPRQAATLPVPTPDAKPQGQK